MHPPDVICVVDDDPLQRQLLAALLEAPGVEVRGYAAGRDFLDDAANREAACVLLDVSMPGLSGLEVQAAMLERGMGVPVIFVTGHGDVPMAVEAMRGGAVDFLEKPFDRQALLSRVRQAIERGRELRLEQRRRTLAELRLEVLSAREREVLALLVDGGRNKSIATELGISDKTVENHRASIMRKLDARSVAELVRLAVDAGLGRPDRP